MIVETASAFVASISALSSIIKAVKATKELTEDAATIADTIAKTMEPDNLSVKALAATKLDSEYIEIATENIKRATKRFKDSWRDPALPQAGKDQELEVASYVICNELNRVKSLNGNVLPAEDRFHDLWDAHGCT